MKNFVVVAALAAAFVTSGCGGSGAPATNSGSGYEEYTCPDPIGKIVREDCSRVGLRYDGESFEGSVGVGGVGASASYKETAIRQADSLIQLLKEQRVAMCNNFNTCKLTVAEYREDQKRIDDSFIALMSLKDRMKDMDADQASQLLREIQSIRTGVQNVASAQADAAAAKPEATTEPPKPEAPPTAAPPPTTPPATGEFSCKGPAVQLFRRGTIAGPTFGYDLTRKGLKGHPELASVDFVEFLLETATLSGKKQEYVLVGISPDGATSDKLKTVVKSFSPSAGVDIPCPAIAPVRKMDFDVN
jgi:hypothetical protein